MRRAAERFTDEHAAGATARLATLNALADENSPETWAAHTAFHFALYEAAGLGLADPGDPAAVGDEPALPPRGERARASSPTRRAEHATILQACVDHDAELAPRCRCTTT